MLKSRLYLRLLLSSICLFGVACNHDFVPVEPIAKAKDTLLIYIMAGQSNMAGRGVMEPQDTATDPRILVVDSSGSLSVAQEPLHVYHPGFSGLDCGMSFANTLLPSIPAGSKICLVPCAMSSTSVEEWLGDSLRGQKLYTNMMNRARLAMKSGVLK